MTTSKRLVVVLSHITVILLGLATIIVADIGGPRGWKRWSFLIPPAAFMRSMGLIVNRGGNTINPGAVGSCPRNRNARRVTASHFRPRLV